MPWLRVILWTILKGDLTVIDIKSLIRATETGLVKTNTISQ